MLIESIPGEPLSFHVIPFDNPRLQYTLQVSVIISYHVIVSYLISEKADLICTCENCILTEQSFICFLGAQFRAKERMDVTDKESDTREL